MSTSVGPLPAGRSRSELVAEVAANLEHLRAGATAVVACSGGPDSSALAHLVADARPDLALVLVHVAHGLRARSAELADRAVVATHAAWLGADLVGCDLEVASSGRGLEAAARDARYASLREVAADRGAEAILVGHSADDQAETVLLRITRGTGVDGLAAMTIVSGDLSRPLLRLRRSDLHAFAAGEGLLVSHDETNDDAAIRRVRVRREVLPALARIGPDPVASLGRLAGLARDDAAALDAAAAALPDAIRTVGPVVALRTDALRSVPVAIGRRVVRRGLALLVDRPPSAATVACVLDAREGYAATLPGGVAFRVEREWRTLVVVDDGSVGAVGGSVGAVGGSVGGEVAADGGGMAPGTDRGTALAMGPDGTGTVAWRSAGLTLRLLRPPDPETPDAAGDPVARHDHGGDQIALSLPGLWSPPRHRVDDHRTAPGTIASRYTVTFPDDGEGLEVRAVAPGDRIRGPGGTRRVVDVLREAGMPRAIRSRWPLLWRLGDDPVVVWIPGVAVDGAFHAAGRRRPGIAIHASPSSGVAPGRHHGLVSRPRG